MNIGINIYSADENVGTAIGKMIELYPQLTINIHHYNPIVITALLKSGELDIALTSATLENMDESFIAKPLKTQKAMICCRRGHPILEKAAYFCLILNLILLYYFVALRK